MLNRKNRISNRHLLAKINKEGGRYDVKLFIIKYLPSIEPISKFAVIVSKKIAPKAVTRNKLKRQICESLRINLPLLKKHIVATLILKKTSEEHSFTEINSQIIDFFNHFK